jgi:putative transcriptional regulator
MRGCGHDEATFPEAWFCASLPRGDRGAEIVFWIAFCCAGGAEHPIRAIAKVADGGGRSVVREAAVKSLGGQLLVAMPQMQDPRFARSVVYLCAHSAESGAMGLVINRLLGSLTMDDLFGHLEIEPPRTNLPHPVHFGGPVEAARGFVLHTADYREAATLVVDGNIAVTATLDILRAIGRGEGPRRCLLALGYAGWAPGQLDSEIQANGWLSVAADAELVFDPDLDGKWQRALAKLGVDLSMLSTDAGHA